MFATIGYFFDHLGLFIINAIVACGSAAAFGVIVAFFLCSMVDIRLKGGSDPNQDSVPATFGGGLIGAVVGLALSIWLLTFKSTGTVVSNMLGIALVGIIVLFIITRIYKRIYKRIKNAQPSVKPKVQYPRHW